MKRLVIRLAVVAVLLSLACSAFGEVPRILTIQGKLTDSLGQPVPDGVQSVTFRIYEVETCGQGTALWQEEQNVQTNGGIFNVNLGAVTPITLAFDKQYWLGMQPPACGELCPRTRLTTAAYAVRAEVAETVVSGAITADKLAPGVAIPPGVILMWSGSAGSIPQGWALCDGTNGTPDLRDMFVVGAGTKYAVGANGGLESVTLTVAQMPAHNHGVNDPGHSHAISRQNWCPEGRGMWTIGNTGEADNRGYLSTDITGITIQGAGGGLAHENRPPYYALCYIMKLGY